ncbi:hypothetical protein [Chamaesiphon sp. OTE_8_metabat_110]|uniref:hypothetical protein n=1 Tax=Chamaesiphon sp. OTE_8_metabat_110 TaxID=2964696 RepID=UPI00286CC7C8|nr:hypothetical protein [Chamaesiphon sp. OTE_8_metabat_110]
MSNLIVFAAYHPNASAPYYWQEDQTGVMRRAVEYYNRQMCGNDPSLDLRYHQEQIDVLVKYFDNYLMAPCWRSLGKQIFELRRRLWQAQTISQLNECHQLALELGLDPL